MEILKSRKNYVISTSKTFLFVYAIGDWSNSDTHTPYSDHNYTIQLVILYDSIT